MERGQLRKLNLCYAGIQSLYWAGFAAIWAFLSVLLLYRGFSNSQIGTVSALALLMPLIVQPVLASLADRNRRFTSRRLAMALTGLLLLCAVGLWCSAGSMAVTAALYVLVGISLTATGPFHSAMAMELQQHGVALNYGLSRGLGSACYAASVLVLGVVVERYAPTAVLPVFAGEMLLLLLLTWRFRASPTAGGRRRKRPGAVRGTAAAALPRLHMAAGRLCAADGLPQRHLHLHDPYRGQGGRQREHDGLGAGGGGVSGAARHGPVQPGAAEGAVGVAADLLRRLFSSSGRGCSGQPGRCRCCIWRQRWTSSSTASSSPPRYTMWPNTSTRPIR